MRVWLLFAGFLVAIACIAAAIRPSRPLEPGTVSLERISAELIPAVRGTPVVSEFHLRNDTRYSVSIEGVRTGCGCAVLTAGERQALGRTIPPNDFLKASLKVDTTNRAMGDFSIPIDLFISDEQGTHYQLHAIQRIRVNPGWATSKQRLTLQANAEPSRTVTDEFILFQTSPERPFEVTEATIKREGVQIDLHELDPEECAEEFVAGKGGQMQWKAIPRYRVRVGIPAAAITTRETAQLSLQLSHELTRVALHVELVPAVQPLRTTPAKLTLDNDAASSTREFVVSTEAPVGSVTIRPPVGVAILSTTPLAEKLLKVNVQVDHDTWDGEAIIVQDESGHRQTVAVVRAR
ncbi:MAG: hypothetical protein ACC628_10580 [Pirellulaceae bacterium]